MGDSTMELAYRHGWKPKGNRPRNYRWEHPTHGVLKGSGPSSTEAPWVWRPNGADHEYHYRSMGEALEDIHAVRFTIEPEPTEPGTPGRGE